MLKMQLLGHASIKEEIKLFLREAGVIHVTDVSLDEKRNEFEEEKVRETEKLLEQTEETLAFLDEYSEKLSFAQRLSKRPMVTSPEEVDKIEHDVPVDVMYEECNTIQTAVRKVRDDLARGKELVRTLEPWRDLTVSFESLSTENYEVQFWSFPEKTVESVFGRAEEPFTYVQFDEVSRIGGRSYMAVILPRERGEVVGEALKELGGFRFSTEKLTGTPSEIIDAERNRWGALEKEITKAQDRARKLAAERDDLLILSDHYRESIGLGSVERHFHQTDSTFLMEGWIRTLDRKRLEKDLHARYRDIEVSFREPLNDEEPPISLENKGVVQPYEFVTTLYGRPVYREIDPTPLLAPFFILFFALCLTDAGYGLTLAAVSALVIVKLKPRGGLGLLFRLLFMGGIITAIVGFITGGIFGIEAESLPPFIQRFVFINPLEEPMTMLNIAFLMGLVHILFGMGIKMAANVRAGLVADAVFDNLFWILFLIALAPLGYSAILGGEIPPEVSFWSSRAALVLAAGIFITGGRKQKNIIAKFFKGLIGFYDIVGYFGDVLSYARLLALGLATSAIALAVNGIAEMVSGLPYYTGYVAAVLVLVLGHAFNLAVNTLGAFVHSGRLQYLEFFSKFFAGGGKEFRPFKTERNYSILERLQE